MRFDVLTEVKRQVYKLIWLANKKANFKINMLWLLFMLPEVGFELKNEIEVCCYVLK
jgi:hypothetical protein